ncbi:restriction endonuclease subunit S, partial [Dellaglioa algida]
KGLPELKEINQAFLQGMLSKNNVLPPKIRFATFIGDWEQRKLGEAVSFLNGKAYKQQELLNEGKYRVLRVGNFNTNNKWYYSDLELEENKYANRGDLLYLWATDFKPEIWTHERVIFHYHIWKLVITTTDVDKQFLYVWLMNDREQIKKNTNGTTMVHVTKGNMEQRLFGFPSNEEQVKLGLFFKKFASIIDLHQQKIDKLQQIKKAYLQKMFI